MISHIYHDDLAGYDQRQILHDGCPECEHRGAHVELALAHLDNERFVKAWQRTRAFSRGDRSIGPVSRAEAPLLRALALVQALLATAEVSSGPLQDWWAAEVDRLQQVP